MTWLINTRHPACSQRYTSFLNSWFLLLEAADSWGSDGLYMSVVSVFSLLVPEPWTARPGRGNWIKLSRRWGDHPAGQSHCHPHHIFCWQPAPSLSLRALSQPWRSPESYLDSFIVLSLNLSLLTGSVALWYELEPGKCYIEICLFLFHNDKRRTMHKALFPF